MCVIWVYTKKMVRNYVTNNLGVTILMVHLTIMLNIWDISHQLVDNRNQRFFPAVHNTSKIISSYFILLQIFQVIN